MDKPEDIQIIGDLIAFRWADGREDFVPMAQLRALSPSAETRGEHDLFGKLIGGNPDPGRDFSGVAVTGWVPVGGYAIQFAFSDGHNTGIYSFDYLREIGNALRERET